MIRVALYRPDIPQNAGTILRTCACLSVPVDVIEPCGFVWDDARLKRAGMDYLELANCTRHVSFERFEAAVRPGRLVLATTKAETGFLGFSFRDGDVLLFGRESAGVPEAVHAKADARIRVPMAPEARSLNLAVCCGLVLGEALRQTVGPAFFQGPVKEELIGEKDRHG